MCRRVEDLLEACDKWNLSIGVAKGFWGMDKVGYLGHRVSIGGLEASPKDLKSLTDLPFPGSLRSMQSFLGSLNYYSRFIEDYAIYASVLYELREVEFAELEKRSDLREILDRNDPIARDHDPTELKLAGSTRGGFASGLHRLENQDRDDPGPPSFRRDENAGDYRICQRLGDIRFVDARTRRDLPPGRVRQSHLEDERVELQCDGERGVGVAEDLRSLLQFASGTQDPGPDEAFHVSLDVQVIGVAGPLEAMVCPLVPMDTRDHEVYEGAKIDDALTEIAPRKEPKRRIQAPIPTVDRDEELWVISFDGSARVKRGGGAFSAILWSLPGWEVVKARSGYLESLTVNEVEYNGLILGLDILEGLDRRRLVICGDSNLVIRQRDWNGSADSLASAALQRQRGIEVLETPEYQDLVTVNRLDEILIPKTENPVVRVAAVTTRAGRARSPAGVMDEGLIREIRVDRIKQAQEEKVWVAGMKKYLSGSIAGLTQAEARSYGKIAADYEVDEHRTSYTTITPRWKEDTKEWGGPTSGSEITSSIGGDYTGVSRDCETGKGKPVIRGESPGNLQATYPFQIIAMDHI
ncbi:LOW QUALITY PROTEIN: reverse transcriptase, partial [Phytophthora megakarya]